MLKWCYTNTICFSKRNGERLIMSSSPSLNTIRSLHCVLCKLEVLINSWNTNQGEKLWSLNCKYQPFLYKNHPNKDAFLNPSYNPKEKTFLLSVNFLWWSDHHHIVLYYLIKPKFRKCTSNKQVITDHIASETSTEHFFWIFL